ncbi:MAG: hypothetical protein J6J17_03440 [Bacilli bacterium]|nr:hypothetical protein [Bacilli bacterium]
MGYINRINDKQIIKIILLVIFLMMFILNSLTPLIADDYSYSLMSGDSEITGLIDIINNQISHYINWGGRSVAHTIAQIFLFFKNKIIFNLFNSFMYCALIYFIYKHSTINYEKEKPMLIVIIHLLIWIFMPVFGQTCIWLVGSCNYLWMSTLILSFLYIIRKERVNNNIFYAILLFIIGILAGWTNENTSFGLIVIIILTLIAKKRKNEKILKYQITGLLGSICGFITLILAPGNFVRSSQITENTSFMLKYSSRIFNCTIGFFEHVMPLIFIVIIIFTIIKYKKIKIINYDFQIFIVASILVVYAMGMSRTFPERAYFGSIIFCIISVIDLLFILLEKYRLIRYICCTLTIIFSLTFINDYLILAKDINQYRIVIRDRLSYIEQQRNEGNIDIVVQYYDTSNKRSPKYDLIDVSKDANGWPNTAMAKILNIKSIRSE